MNILHMLHSLDCRINKNGVTVRRGPKWSQTVQPGDLIILCVCTDQAVDTTQGGLLSPLMKHDHRGMALVLSNDIYRFRDIPARLLEMEHEERSRQYSGLLQSMRKAYGSTFEESEECTVLMYRRTS